MRIVHYYPRALVGDGGCSASVRGWASAEAEAGVDVVVAYDADGPQLEDGAGFVHVDHRGWGRLRGPVGLGNLLHGADLLVLHSGWVLHNVVAAAVANRAKVPYVVTPHGAYNPNVFRRGRATKSAWWRVFEKRVLARASTVHLFFEEEAVLMADVGYRGPFVIAPNGITVPHFGDEPRRQHFVLWMGRFDIQAKGIDLMLQAHARLPKAARAPLRLHGPDWRQGKQRVRQMGGDLGLGSTVTVGPAVYGEEKWKLLRECGLFLFTPRWDSSSVMALEAAGAEAPIVATSTTFIGRRLAEHGGAFLVEPTPEAIAEGIQAGLSERGLAAGARAGTMIRERFTWPVVAHRLLDQLEPVR
jgi:glycosyltransferase involved in cell wall biosynthesis